MNVPQDQLDSLAASALRLRALVQHAMRQSGQTQFDTLTEASTLFAVHITKLKAVGAADPRDKTQAAPGDVPPVSAGDVPLRLLDTPANRRYRDALREAWDAGLAVDRERYGENIGTDGCAQIIEMVLADVEQEIGGADGAGLE